MEYELGAMDPVATIELFADLIKNGMAWQLQGHYGRTAQSLIDGALIDKFGNINLEQLPEAI